MAVGKARRARLILLLDEGTSRRAIMNELRCDSRFITTLHTRFASDRLAGLYDRHPGVLRMVTWRVLKRECGTTRCDANWPTARHTAATESWPRSWARASRRCSISNATTAIGRIISIPTWCSTIPTLRPRLSMRSACT
ncbi:helix-turn-helix domain-containing protein [Burkholderia lata]|uniref:helix-turn-helix domain-containing protein n=1 Tax=Burkholderia lata (strain ATCC 17760 / DSM 23089 / LMG 22485 / NCIMB 9086 / R18194 / 383) TaxID=482957 RepID=UPI0034A09CEB